MGKNKTFLKQINSKVANLRRDRPIWNEELQVLKDQLVGLQVCWSALGFSGGASSEPGCDQWDQDGGLHLWYCSNSNQISAFAGIIKAMETIYGYPKPCSLHAGISCYKWGGGGVTYPILVNMNAKAEIWWKISNIALKVYLFIPSINGKNVSFCSPDI